MLAIEKVVRILNEEDYSQLKNSLESSRAHKFSDLLTMYRNGDTDNNLHEKLNVTRNAFNVLKSRLYEKLQKHLINNGAVTSDSLYIHAINIPDLIYKMDRDLAITILDGLEKEFRELDLPEYLTVIHAAQKRLFFNTSKFYHYSKQYNRSVAFQLALNKAEEEFFGYKQMLGRFYLSGNKALIQGLGIYKQEIEQIARLNESPRFRLFQNLIKASHAIHIPEDISAQSFSIDGLLRETKDLINDLPGNVFTVYYKKAVDSLLFVYYCRNGLFHNASEHLTSSITDSTELINYSNIVCVIPYLDQRIIYAIRKNERPVIFDVNIDDISGQEQEDAIPYVSIMKYNVLAYTIREEYLQAYHCAKLLFNSVSFKGLPVLEIEVKCFYMILALLLEKEVNIETISNSVTRKIREIELDENDKERISLLVRLIKLKSGGVGEQERLKFESTYNSLIQTKGFYFNALQKIFTNEPFKNLFLR